MSDDHNCDTGIFDRSLCGWCGWMHSYCTVCGDLTDQSGCTSGTRVDLV